MPDPIRIGYHPAWGPIFVAIAVIDLVVYVLTGARVQILLGALMAVVGVLYFTRPFLVLDAGVLQVKNLVGFTMRRVRYGKLAELEVLHDAILVGRGAQPQRLKISRMMTSRRDLDRLAEAIREARAQESAG